METMRRRFTEFSRVAIEFMKRVWLPDVVHCHDWQTALVPVLLRTQHAVDPAVRSLPTVLTIHNLGYQGVFPVTALRRAGLPEDFSRGRFGVLRSRELPEGRSAFCRLSHYGQPQIREGDSKPPNTDGAWKAWSKAAETG